MFVVVLNVHLLNMALELNLMHYQYGRQDFCAIANRILKPFHVQQTDQLHISGVHQIMLHLWVSYYFDHFLLISGVANRLY